MPSDDAAQRGPERFRVLIVMDDHPLTRVVVLALRHGAYEVRIERTLADARVALAEMRPHLAIIDIQADAGRTIELVDDQVESRRLPTLALTRRDDLQENLAVIDRGADDILTIPFVPAELITRVRAAIRRTHGERVHFVPVIHIGDLSIDILNRRVRIGASEIHLTGLEQALLYLLAANSGTIVTRDLILDSLWGPDFVTETNVVERHIRALRVKLRDDLSKTPYIQTVHGEGYRFVLQSG
jgi:DNA-binding response OmpR family regulator